MADTHLETASCGCAAPVQRTGATRGRTGPEYRDYVRGELLEAETREDALGILERIRQQLLDGSLKINKATGIPK